ncbi:MAG: B12-binding domain-containing radical SAM protein [Methylococcaceae bacterium]|nr:B12-binding domain-containing radical SAM protein [Methylococcaceae bacterium]
MGILYIAAELQQAGHIVSILDADIDGMTAQETADHILKCQPDLVGFSIMTPQVPCCLETCLLLKRRAPDLPIVLGGAHIASTLDDIFTQSDDFDFVAVGEGEVTMLEICQNMESSRLLPDVLKGVGGIIYKSEQGDITANPPRAFFKELDEFAPIDYSLVDVFKYKIPTLPGPPVVGLMITRGCPFKCTYCDAPTTTGRKIRYHSPGRAVQDIVRLNKQFGVRGFSFRDSTFTASKRWVREFCEKLIASGVDIAWRCNTRVDCVTEDLLRLMKQSGCHTINFGVESGHPEILKRIKKDVPIETVYDAHRWTREVGIRTYTTFLVGSPGETDETIRATIEVAKKARPSMAMFFVTIGYPGTEMYREAVNEGLIEQGWWNNQHWNKDENTAFEKRWGWSADAGSLVIPGFDSQGWQRRATREFYLRPQFIWDTLTFILRNPYFLQHAVKLSFEILPWRKLVFWKKSRINESHKVYSRCPEAATWDYKKRKDIPELQITSSGAVQRQKEIIMIPKDIPSISFRDSGLSKLRSDAAARKRSPMPLLDS